MERRKFLALLGIPIYAELARRIGLQTAPDNPKADVTIHISPVKMEVAGRKMIKTTGYNGSVPGPVLGLQSGKEFRVKTTAPSRKSVEWLLTGEG